MRCGPLALVMLAACGAGAGADDDGDGAPCGAAGCPIDAPETECSARIGDRGLPIELVPLRTDGTTLSDLADADALGLFMPPQGGMVVLVGARARNIDGCAATVSATLRDGAGGLVVGSESRPEALIARADGWGYPREPLFFSLANVALCPVAGLPRDVYDQAWQLEVRLDDGPRSAVVTRTVTPTCPTTGVEAEICRCMCDADYQPGVACGGAAAAPPLTARGRP